MWCVVGLGNPGPRYARTRHNVGFQLVDRLCETSGLRIDRRTSQVAWGTGGWCGDRLVLAKPLTYMNLSGMAVRALMRQARCDASGLMVAHDDLDLALGRLRIKSKGGDGGHKGVRSIVEALGDDRFLRMRIGIGRPPAGMEATDYVLEPFGEEEWVVMEGTLERAVEALQVLTQRGAQEAMRLFHPSATRQT